MQAVFVKSPPSTLVGCIPRMEQQINTSPLNVGTAMLFEMQVRVTAALQQPLATHRSPSSTQVRFLYLVQFVAGDGRTTVVLGARLVQETLRVAAAANWETGTPMQKSLDAMLWDSPGKPWVLLRSDPRLQGLLGILTVMRAVLVQRAGSWGGPGGRGAAPGQLGLQLPPWSAVAAHLAPSMPYWGRQRVGSALSSQRWRLDDGCDSWAHLTGRLPWGLFGRLQLPPALAAAPADTPVAPTAAAPSPIAPGTLRNQLSSRAPPPPPPPQEQGAAAVRDLLSGVALLCPLLLRAGAMLGITPSPEICTQAVACAVWAASRRDLPICGRVQLFCGQLGAAGCAFERGLPPRDEWHYRYMLRSTHLGSGGAASGGAGSVSAFVASAASSPDSAPLHRWAAILPIGCLEPLCHGLPLLRPHAGADAAAESARFRGALEHGLAALQGGGCSEELGQAVALAANHALREATARALVAAADENHDLRSEIAGLRAKAQCWCVRLCGRWWLQRIHSSQVPSPLQHLPRRLAQGILPVRPLRVRRVQRAHPLDLSDMPRPDHEAPGALRRVTRHRWRSARLRVGGRQGADLKGGGVGGERAPDRTAAMLWRHTTLLSLAGKRFDMPGERCSHPAISIMHAKTFACQVASARDEDLDQF